MAQHLFGPNGFIYADEDKNGNVAIMWAGLPYYCFNRRDTLAQNIGIALLAAIGLARKDIQRLFVVSRSTVKRILSVWRASGTEGLKDYHQGAPSLVTQIKEFVID